MSAHTITHETSIDTKPITPQDVEVYESASSYLNHDYNILIVEFDKDREPAIKSKFVAMNLHTMERLFDFEDKIKLLKNFVIKKEAHIAKGKKMKASHFDKERDCLEVLADDFETLRMDMMALRVLLEGSEGYTYKKTSAGFRIIRTTPTRGKLSVTEPEDEAKTVSRTSTKNKSTRSQTRRSLPSSPSTASSDILQHSEASSTEPSFRIYEEKKRKRSLTEHDQAMDFQRQEPDFVDPAPNHAAQAEKKHVTRRASKRKIQKYPAVAVKASISSSTTSRSSKPRREVKMPVVEIDGVISEQLLLDESVVAAIVKRFSSHSTTSAPQDQEVKSLKLKIKEQQARIKEISRYTEVLLKERDELRKDRHDAWEALRDGRTALRNMTDRKNEYKRILRGTKRKRSARVVDDTSDDSGSDSEEEIPAVMKKRYEIP
ncbi:hypothetical protein ONS95_003431 [Cadophora gregata]|uniref:uncharacterized protein n=1 Tax=Cadophora gregata TaxID=51156 RepID=UPI0026DB1F60|nr:uncharacterized protein ONS95_003431 [Cadophora gregata]KAK0108638.1 hypothetical protein ONS95_003431 [Cadophora gregata]KAK0108771.1 hypothetical protein ONS96_002616 [Cadophora gregata f. sp. sojae]